MAVEHEAFLAKRIASWTTKSLLSAMVLVAGLGVGRQVLKWWSDGSRESAPLPTPFQQDDGLGDASRVHILQFGDQCWSIRRQTVVGRVADAAGALRAACRETIAGAQPAGSQPTEAERQFLAKLGRQRPVEEKPGEWQLFQWNEDVPMLVGVRPWPPSSPVGAGTPLAEPGRRVVLWGLAIPAEPGNWTLMAFQPEAGTDSSRDVFPEIPLPPDAKRLISIRVAGVGPLRPSPPWKCRKPGRSSTIVGRHARAGRRLKGGNAPPPAAMSSTFRRSAAPRWRWTFASARMPRDVVRV